MKDIFSIFRLALTLFALPIVATAAVSAHQYMNEAQPIEATSVIAKPAKTKSLLSGTFRNHSVAIDQDGVVRGRIGNAAAAEGMIGLGDMKVFFLKDGEIAYQSYTAADGSFEVAGLEEGNYSFVATGDQGFAAFGVNLSRGLEMATNNLIEVATISPSFRGLAKILEGKLPGSVVDSIFASSQPGEPITGSNRVQIIDGKVNGVLANSSVKEGQDAKVHLIKQSEKVGEAQVDENGMFTFEDVEPGVYEFVAAGSEGIAALGFEAVVQDEVPAGGSDAQFASPMLDVLTTYGPDRVIVFEQYNFYNTPQDALPPGVDPGFVPTEISSGIAAGGYGAPAGFGGGGFGGGGGLVSLGRFAILGWILTELFDEIDFSRNDNLPPASPSVS